MTDYVVVARVLDGSSAHEFVISRHPNERERNRALKRFRRELAEGNYSYDVLDFQPSERERASDNWDYEDED